MLSRQAISARVVCLAGYNNVYQCRHLDAVLQLRARTPLQLRSLTAYH